MFNMLFKSFPSINCWEPIIIVNLNEFYPEFVKSIYLFSSSTPTSVLIVSFTVALKVNEKSQ